MKQLFPILFLLALLHSACQSSPDYKDIRKEVVDIHDEAMKKTGIMVRNKMKLDTLLLRLDSLKKQKPSTDTAQMRIEISGLIKNLKAADDQMNDWMHEFNPDASEKSNQEAVEYFKQQLVEVKNIDSLCQSEVERSNAYLQKIYSN